MWYFAWMLGVGFAVAFAILNAMWFELHTGLTAKMRAAALNRGPHRAVGSCDHRCSTALTISVGADAVSVPAPRRARQPPSCRAARSADRRRRARSVHGVGYRPDSRCVADPVRTRMRLGDDGDRCVAAAWPEAPSHIGGVMPSRPTPIRLASSVPSSFLVAPKMMTLAPGFNSTLVAGDKGDDRRIRRRPRLSSRRPCT